MLDDARAVIETDVDPGGECEVQLHVVAPGQPGDYELEVDLLQELIGWFADRGSSTLKLPVTVAAEPERAGERRSRSGGTTDESEPAGRVRAADGDARHGARRRGRDARGRGRRGAGRDREGPVRSVDAEPRLCRRTSRRATPTRSRGERRNPQAVIEARIRGALEDGSHASRARAKQLLAADPQRSERRERALRLMDERADLVGFASDQHVERRWPRKHGVAR